MRKLHEVVSDIVADWKKPYFGAVPYIRAMRYLDSVKDNYGLDSGESLVTYFLANATTWRGEKARAIKSELKSMLGGN